MRSFWIFASLALVFGVFSTTTEAQTGGTGIPGIGTGTPGTGTGTQGIGALTSGTSSSSTSSASNRTSSTSTGSSGSRSSGVSLPTGPATDNMSNAGQSFVGGTASTDSFVGGNRQAQGQQMQNRQFQQFQNTQTSTGNRNQTQSGTPRQVQSVLRVGFTFSGGTVSQQSGRMDAVNSLSLSRYAASHPEFSDVMVELNTDGVAVLTGTIRDEESSRLAANLIRFQPGVRRVNNQLNVSR